MTSIPAGADRIHQTLVQRVKLDVTIVGSNGSVGVIDDGREGFAPAKYTLQPGHVNVDIPGHCAHTPDVITWTKFVVTGKVSITNELVDDQSPILRVQRE